MSDDLDTSRKTEKAPGTEHILFNSSIRFTEDFKNFLLVELDLTTRETEVVEQLCLVKSNFNIGKALNITEKTVKLYLTGIYKKFKVTSRMELFHKLVVMIQFGKTASMIEKVYCEDCPKNKAEKLPSGAW